MGYSQYQLVQDFFHQLHVYIWRVHYSSIHNILSLSLANIYIYILSSSGNYLPKYQASCNRKIVFNRSLLASIFLVIPPILGDMTGDPQKTWHSLPETNSKFAPENMPKPNRKGLYSNHQFSGAKMLVSGRVPQKHQSTAVNDWMPWSGFSWGPDLIVPAGCVPWEGLGIVGWGSLVNNLEVIRFTLRILGPSNGGVGTCIAGVYRFSK